MNKLAVILLLGIGLMTLFTGCEKTDYQHPMHRNGSK